MRFLALAAILAIAASIVTPLSAADRPVGPETGQARVGEDGLAPGTEPDGASAFDSRTFSGRGFGADSEIPWSSWWRCYMNSWSGNCGGSGF